MLGFVAQLMRLQRKVGSNMKVHCYVAMLALSFVGYAQQTDGVHFSGIAINTTDREKPVAAQSCLWEILAVR
jgi:hypothetical protein